MKSLQAGGCKASATTDGAIDLTTQSGVDQRILFANLLGSERDIKAAMEQARQRGRRPKLWIAKDAKTLCSADGQADKRQHTTFRKYSALQRARMLKLRLPEKLARDFSNGDQVAYVSLDNTGHSVVEIVRFTSAYFDYGNQAPDSFKHGAAPEESRDFVFGDVTKTLAGPFYIE